MCLFFLIGSTLAINSGKFWYDCGPTTISTQGDLFIISLPWAWATQPATATIDFLPVFSFLKFICFLIRPSSE